MNYLFENETLTLFLEGRIDSSNAAQTEKEAVELLTANPCKKLVADASKLAYISSAGLRVLLRLKKLQPDFAVVEVSTDVNEILEMTGFSEMLEVHKALRTVSVEGCRCIGQGATGAVYRLDEERLVKVYFGGFGMQDIQREKKIAQNAFLAGVPTAISFDVVKVEGKGYGLVYELLHAKDLSDCLAEDGEHLDDYVRLHANFLRECHRIEVDPEKFVDIKTQTLARSAYLPESMFTPEAREKYQALVRSIPDRNTYIHGDAHVGNVMLVEGEPVFIDMMSNGYGHPIFDLLSTYHLFCFVGQSEVLRKRSVVTARLTAQQCLRAWEVFLSTYLGTEEPEVLRKVEHQLDIVRSARFLLATIRFPDMFPPEEVARMKQTVQDADAAELSTFCF